MCGIPPCGGGGGGGMFDHPHLADMVPNSLVAFTTSAVSRRAYSTSSYPHPQGTAKRPIICWDQAVRDTCGTFDRLSKVQVESSQKKRGTGMCTFPNFLEHVHMNVKSTEKIIPQQNKGKRQYYIIYDPCECVCCASLRRFEHGDHGNCAY